MLIVEEADILDPTMIVVGKRGLSMLAKLIMGSVSDYVMQHASCPVMVIHWYTDRQTDRQLSLSLTSEC